MMMQQTMEQMEQAQTSQIRRRPQRSADAILARAAARRSDRHVFAPDHLHGSWTLGAAANALGAAWVAGAVWIERLLDTRGEVLGYTSARFDEDFLVVEHVWAPDDQEARERWLTAQLIHARSVVWLELGPQRTSITSDLIIRYNLSAAQLRALELEQLHVTRDIEWVEADAERAEATRAQSRTNIMSTICLCAVGACEPAEDRAA
jgi:hypothetical protein